MTIPQPGADPRTYIDVNNSLLARVPVLLETSHVTIPGTETLGVITFRAATTTFTALVTKAELQRWIREFQKLDGQMSSAGLIVAGPGNAVPPGPNGRPGA
jgi:hypothetical protein